MVNNPRKVVEKILLWPIAHRHNRLLCYTKYGNALARRKSFSIKSFRHLLWYWPYCNRAAWNYAVVFCSARISEKWRRDRNRQILSPPPFPSPSLPRRCTKNKKKIEKEKEEEGELLSIRIPYPTPGFSDTFYHVSPTLRDIDFMSDAFIISCSDHSICVPARRK